MKKLFYFSTLIILLISSCVKDKIQLEKPNIKEFNEKLSSVGIKINPSTYQRIEINKETFIDIVDADFHTIKIVDGFNKIKASALTYNGKKYYNIIQFTSESEVSDQELKVTILNSYKHSLHLNSEVEVNSKGLLTYIKLTGEIFQAEYIDKGKFASPVTLANIPNVKINSAVEIVKSRNSQSIGITNGKIMSAGEGCTDWYYVETWRNAEGEVVAMKEDYVFTTCPGTGAGGGAVARESISNSSFKLVCPSTFEFKNTASNWQAAYVKNYKYAFMGTDRLGNPIRYFITMDFEIGLGRNLASREDAQRYATRALNIAEAKVAEKISSGHYSSQGVKAPLLLKKDLMNEMRTYFNRQLRLIDNSSATTVNQGRVTAGENDGVDAVFIGFFGC
ncbi:hypothetical protein [Pedobacter sp. UBA5917]|jgi:hypothetical protein|uniref:hypothetical protein n=1 Tax=Pedobacter sp. UBA5917 TaxID=1947061 RepID=UPI0025CF792A|nr:hypothetical protein [Pedobacter sp. UBA5917]